MVISATSAAEFARKLFGEQEYTSIIELLPKYPNDIDVMFYAALSLECLGKEEDAIEILENITKENPKHIDALRTLIWHYSNNEYKQLINLELLAKTEEIEADEMCRMGEIYIKMDRLSIAHHWFRKALEKEPNNCLALLGIAQIHSKLAISYMKLVEKTNEIDLNDQLSDERSVEDLMRFICNEMLLKPAFVTEKEFVY